MQRELQEKPSGSGLSRGKAEFLKFGNSWITPQYIFFSFPPFLHVPVEKGVVVSKKKKCSQISRILREGNLLDTKSCDTKMTG